MKTARAVLSIGLGITFLMLVAHPVVAGGTEEARRPGGPGPYAPTVPGARFVMLGAQLNGQGELPPNTSPLYAAARFTLRGYPFILPPVPGTNRPPGLTNFPPILITNRPPILISNPPPAILITNPIHIFPSNPPPILITNPLPPYLPPTGAGGSSGGVVVGTLVATPTLVQLPPEFPGRGTNYLQGYVVFPPAVLTNGLGVLPGTASLEDEAGNPLSNLVVVGTSPIRVSTGNPGDNDIPAVSGGFVLTPEQSVDLLAGRWFVRVQAVTTAGENYPAGAIRGRIVPVDSDGDSVPDYLDVCPGTEPGAAVDTNGCSVAQHCPCLGFWQNHGEYVGCVQTTAASFLQQGIIGAGERASLVREAARSDSGRRLIPAAPHSGISGQSMLYMGGAFGSVPYPASFKILSQAGTLLTQTGTDGQGQFQVNLPPGVYTIVPWLPTVPDSEPGGLIFVFYPLAEPTTVTVPFKQFTNVVISYSYEPWQF